ncbi:MAG: hypothetical protein KF779_03785 [Hyphomonadaceae bacterium]|nr:hypothetical protein [Hyphomonadaceae bacterium]MCA8885904.1 hypothetical protein [Hyphomonadaceae bacterium]
MLMYIWFAVMMQAFVPGGDRLAAFQSASFETHLRNEIGAGDLVGAASHVARYTPLTARAR